MNQIVILANEIDYNYFVKNVINWDCEYNWAQAPEFETVQNEFWFSVVPLPQTDDDDNEESDDEDVYKVPTSNEPINDNIPIGVNVLYKVQWVDCFQ